MCKKHLYDKQMYKKHIIKIHKDLKLSDEEIEQKIKETPEEKIKCNHCNKEYYRLNYFKKHKCSAKEQVKKEITENNVLDEKTREFIFKIIEHSLKPTNNGNGNINNNIKDGDHNTINNTNTNTNNSNNTNLTIGTMNNMKINILNVDETNLEPVRNREFIENISVFLEENVTKGYNGKIYHQDNINKLMTDTFKKLHCNKKYPENYNVYASNKDPYKSYDVYKNNEWQRMTDTKEMQDILKYDLNGLIDYYNELINENNYDKDDINIFKEIVKNLKTLSYQFNENTKIGRKISHESLQLANEHKFEIGKQYKLSMNPNMTIVPKNKKLFNE